MYSAGMPAPGPRVIRPTVCRIVEYVANPNEQFLSSRGQPLAAIVTYVWNDRLVNLAVFDADGEQVPRTSVMLCQPDDPVPVTSYCRWMTYQQGQAAKTEDLVGALEKRIVVLEQQVAVLFAIPPTSGPDV
jgi:hypothetical protein